MRVTTCDLHTLREAIEPHDTGARRELYQQREFRDTHRVMDLDVRYRWDLFWLVKGHTLIAASDYLDAHIDTALASIVSPLQAITETRTPTAPAALPAGVKASATA